MARIEAKRDAKRVFLSYVREDQEHATHIRKSLLQAGFEVTWDADIAPGDRWASFIGRSIDEADILIVLLSRAAATSPAMMLEIGSMVRRREEGASSPRIVPVLIKDGDWNLGILNQYQALDASGEAPEAAAQRLVDSLTNYSSSDTGPALAERGHDLDFLRQSEMAMARLEAEHSRRRETLARYSLLSLVASLLAGLAGVSAALASGVLGQGPGLRPELLAALAAVIAVSGAAIGFYFGQRRQDGGRR